MAQRENFSSEVMTALKNSLSIFAKISDGLGFCLSAEGDLLSQWRGYAQDGAGVAIGFSGEYLRSMGRQHNKGPHGGFLLEPVIYDSATQEESLREIVEKISEHIHDGAFRDLSLSLLASGCLTKKRSVMKKRRRQHMFDYGNCFRFFIDTSQWRLQKKRNGDCCII
ncbi:DUF2971 domain-containing protein [Herbaspirillum lusitanum]|uniref:DUF2971 domain-containing protein n=1 Tax=Herbaspirillum lusitanum TaxID=213312 RepID=UPI002238C617|nr:DUF2971 domain-containing protein [Herbaspirillum lusitanum]MCW5297735.1 DUF2971 domain-containing protein [Herbaspirillum lusitanum]